MKDIPDDWFELKHDPDLSGLTPNQCFAIGRECAMFSELLFSQEDEFIRCVYGPNTNRLARLVKATGRTVAIEAIDKDWNRLTVSAR